MEFQITPLDWLKNVFAFVFLLAMEGLLVYAIFRLTKDAVRYIKDEKSFVDKFLDVVFGAIILFILFTLSFVTLFSTKDAFLILYDLSIGNYGIIVEDTPKDVLYGKRHTKSKGNINTYTFVFDDGKKYTFDEDDFTREELRLIKNNREYVVKILSTKHGSPEHFYNFIKVKVEPKE